MAIMRRPRADLVPVQPSAQAPAPMVPLDGYVVLEVDEYLEARPPAYSKIGEKWADIITPTRKLARGYLWLTYTWVRSAVGFALVMAIVIIVFLRFTA